MTQQNAERLLAHYEALMNSREVSEQVRKNAAAAYAQMHANMAQYRGLKASTSSSKK